MTKQCLSPNPGRFHGQPNQPTQKLQGKVPVTSLSTSGYNCSENLFRSFLEGTRTFAEQAKDGRYITYRACTGDRSSSGHLAITNHLTTVCKVLAVHSQCKQAPRCKGILVSNHLSCHLKHCFSCIILSCPFKRLMKIS